MKHFFFLGTLIFLVHTIQAQRIRVLDDADGKPLSGVSITSPNQKSRFTTGLDGIALLPSSWRKKEIQVTFSGMISQSIQPEMWTSRLITIRLQHPHTLIAQMEIVSTRLRAPLSSLPGDIFQLTSPAKTNPTNMADALEQSGEVFVQKSQLGGGSPVIRGFEANRILLVVDGVRMNTAIFRAGHLQNLLRLDPNAANLVEVISGSGSSIYGSDALGGVIAVSTQQAQLAQNGKSKEVHAGFMLRHSSGNFQYFDQEAQTNVWINAGFKRWGVRTSLSLGSFGDVRQGAHNARPEWLNTVYAGHVNGQDLAVVNANPLVQRNSGYAQLNVQQRWLLATPNGPRHQFNVQFSTSTAVHRYDRLSEQSSTGNPVYSQWYYGPETYALASYQIDFYTSRRWFDSGRIIAAWQYNQESRVSRRFGNDTKTSRNETVGAYSINGDWLKNVGYTKLYFGFEGYANTVKSTAFSQNIQTGERNAASTRYPAGGSSVMNAALYLTAQRSFFKKLVLTAGMRYTWNILQAEFGEQTFYPFPFTEAKQHTRILCAQAGWVYSPVSRLQIRGNIAQGFRAANVDDLAKVFDSNPGTLLIPNPDLKPERTETVDASVSWNQGGRFSLQTGVFQTWLHDALVTGNARLNGADSVLYDGVLSAVRSNINAQQAVLRGVNARFTWKCFTHYSISATAHYTVGEIVTDSIFVPLDHIPPVYGRVALDRSWNRKWAAGFWVMFHAPKTLDRYNILGEDNLQYATAAGMPGWQTLHVQVSWKPSKTLELNFSCDNLLDQQYRVFASGISAPGRLFRCALKANF